MSQLLNWYVHALRRTNKKVTELIKSYDTALAYYRLLWIAYQTIIPK